MKISFLTFQYPKFYNDRVVLSCNMFCQVSRKMPLGKKISLGHFSGRHFSWGIFFEGIFRRCPEKCPREKNPQENCSPENYPPEILPPEKLPPGKLSPKKLSYQIIVAFNIVLQLFIFKHFIVPSFRGVSSIYNRSTCVSR